MDKTDLREVRLVYLSERGSEIGVMLRYKDKMYDGYLTEVSEMNEEQEDTRRWIIDRLNAEIRFVEKTELPLLRYEYNINGNLGEKRSFG